MSEPAYYFVGDKTYYDRYGARYIEDWLFWGPQVLEPYLRVLGPPMDTDLNDVAFGGFALFPDEKRLLWFGGEDLDYCPFHCRLYLKLMRAIWPAEWRIEWAGRGLHTLARAAGRTPPREVLHPVFGEHGHLYRKQFENLANERLNRIQTIGVVSIVNSQRTRLYSLHDGDITSMYLWAGPDRVLKALGKRFGQEDLYYPTGDEIVGTHGGFHLDFKEKLLAYWSHAPNVVSVPADAWPDWTIIDWEERFEEHVKITNGKLQPVYPPLEDLLIQLERSLVAEEPSDYKVFYQTHEIYDKNWNLIEEIAFPISLPERKQIWTQALQKTGLAHKPYPENWWEAG